MRVFVAAAMLALALAACDGRDWAHNRGKEHGRCYGNMTCNAGLTCFHDGRASGTCFSTKLVLRACEKIGEEPQPKMEVE